MDMHIFGYVLIGLALIYAIVSLRRMAKTVEVQSQQIKMLEIELKIREIEHSLDMTEQRNQLQSERWAAEDELYEQLYPQPDEDDTTQR